MTVTASGPSSRLRRFLGRADVIEARTRVGDAVTRVPAALVYRLRSADTPRNPFRQPLRVQSVEESLDRIVEGRMSVARFGDGEVNIMAGESIGFQTRDPDLQEALREVARSTSQSLAVCIPDVFTSLDYMVPKSAAYWRRSLMMRRALWLRLFDPGRTYFNAFLSRPYMDWRDKDGAGARFDAIKRLWEGRDVVILEGSQSRLGVGNDLFDGATSVRRILCPPTDAWARREEILAAARQVDRDCLLLLALGPAATVLAARLGEQGYQAVDIGHVDVEYEWFLRGVARKVALEGKYVNEEAHTQGAVSTSDDARYGSQVIADLS